MPNESISPGNDDRSILMTQLFSDLQIARFNELYHQRRVAHFRSWARNLGIVTAVAASAAIANAVGKRALLTIQNAA